MVGYLLRMAMGDGIMRKDESQMSRGKTRGNRSSENLVRGIDAVNQLGFYVHLKLNSMSMEFTKPTLVDGVLRL